MLHDINFGLAYISCGHWSAIYDDSEFIVTVENDAIVFVL